MATSITPLQAEMIKAIARSEFTQINGREPDSPNETETWTDEIVNTAQEKGVWASLFNAGLITGMGGAGGFTRLTQKGFDAYKSLA